MGAGRGSFGTRFGFYLAAIGSAFGLGNVWRFPYIVAENGGGAFVLLYVFLVFLIGMPFLLGELSLGSSTKSGVIRGIQSVLEERDSNSSATGSIPWRAVGIFCTLLCLIILSYYAVISGWVLHYLSQFVFGLLDAANFQPQDQLQLLFDNGWLQILLTSVHLLLVLVIVAKDVEEGIEKAVGYMMPIFIVLLSVLFFKVLSLPKSSEAIRFFLYPDFSSLSLSSLGQAVGHVFFTLSVGFGTMVTFGSYLGERVYIPLAGFRVATIDSFLSLFAGLLIFPLVMSTGYLDPGPDLLFRSVPVLMSRITGGHLFGLGFFLCLYLAALGASIGLLETIVSNLIESLRIKRKTACIWAGVLSFLISIVPALSTSVLGDLSLGGQGLLQFFDGLFIHWALPISALLLAQFVLWNVSESKIRDIFSADEQLQVSALKMYAHWRFAIKWVSVPVIIVALALQVASIFLKN
ncbi:MAG: sodium-dependent transporter [Bdellovibrionales bacterium]|nr:sodium-dependent transporter [Bdellovibrionales bacterium]